MSNCWAGDDAAAQGVLTSCTVVAAQEEAKIRDLFQKHDTDGSKGLDEAQMKDFMREYVQTTPGNETKLVSDAEVKCVPPLRYVWRNTGGSRTSYSSSMRVI